MVKASLSKKFAAMGLAVVLSVGTFVMPVFANPYEITDFANEAWGFNGEGYIFQMSDFVEEEVNRGTTLWVAPNSEIKVLNATTKKELGTIKIGAKNTEEDNFKNFDDIIGEKGYAIIKDGEEENGFKLCFLEYSKGSFKDFMEHWYEEDDYYPPYYEKDVSYGGNFLRIYVGNGESQKELAPVPTTELAPTPVVVETPAPQSTPTTTPPAPMPQPEPTPTGKYILTGDLNVRAAATTNSKVLSVLKKGTYPLVLEKTGNWYKIDLGSGKTGFISASYVKDTSNTPSAPAPANAVTKTVNTGALNVRSSAGVGNNIIGVVKKGDTVTVIGIEKGWSKINYNNVTGFVDGNYLK